MHEGGCDESGVRAVEELLDVAEDAAAADVGVAKWWWGTEVERAWAALREAEERTVYLLPDDEVSARGAAVLAYGRRYLAGDDPRVNMLVRLRSATAAGGDPSLAALRACIAEVLRAAHRRADGSQQQARYFRNRLLIASAFSGLFAVLLAVAQWGLPQLNVITPPADWHGTPCVPLVTVMLFGAVGALFTAIPAIAKIPTDLGPFNLPLQQALLKIFFGPLVAVIGLAALSSGVLAVAVPTTWPATFVSAVVFGAGQQAVTRYVDQRAGKILDVGTDGAPVN